MVDASLVRSRGCGSRRASSYPHPPQPPLVAQPLRSLLRRRTAGDRQGIHPEPTDTGAANPARKDGACAARRRSTRSNPRRWLKHTKAALRAQAIRGLWLALHCCSATSMKFMAQTTSMNLRLLRSAPHAPLSSLTGQGGAARRRLRQAMKRLQMRGPCAEMASSVAEDPSANESRRSAAASHEACNPAWTRLSAEGLHKVLVTAGINGWTHTGRSGAERRLRAAAAAERSLPSSAAARAAADSDPAVRAALACNPSCPAVILQRLYRDHVPAVRAAAARNPNCAPHMLNCLESDEAAAVRWSVARNPGCPAETLHRLADDQDSDVRCGTADNPSSAPETLWRLAADDDHAVSTAAAQNPLCPPKALGWLAEDSDAELRRSVAAHPQCPPDVLEWLAEDPDSDVRYVTATNPACPPGALDLLAGDDRADVRAATAANPNCTQDVLDVLAEDADPSVRDAAVHSIVTAFAAAPDTMTAPGLNYPNPERRHRNRGSAALTAR